MKNKVLTLASAVVLFFGTSIAQNKMIQGNIASVNQQQAGTSTQTKHRNCGTMQNLELGMANDPIAGAKQMEENQKIVNEWIKNNANKTQALVTIPVVVHVLYNNSTQQLSSTVINNQITILNQDYSKTNTDVSSVPSAFTSLVGNTDIQFCLATKDPQGNSTTGIVYKSTSKTVFTMEDEGAKKSSLGGDDIWDRNKYLNLWVVPNISLQGSPGILGYAQFPNAPGKDHTTDGVVISYNYFGTGSHVDPNYNKGRTAVHEIGHWLGLHHIWGDNANPDCNDDDGVSDTPVQLGPNFGPSPGNCPSFPSVSCSVSSPNGDMWMNYMDYVEDHCMYMFSVGQGTLMQGVINNFRASLKASTGCGTTSTPPVADFIANTTTVSMGGTVTFSDLSSNGPTAWSWTFAGGTPASSTLQNPVITYNTAGTYNVTLTSSNSFGSSSPVTKSSYITVTNSSCDTIVHYTNFADLTFYVADYKAPYDSGYYFGHTKGIKNGTGYLQFDAFSEKTDYTGSNKLAGVMYILAVAKAGNANSTIAVKAWDNTGTSGSPNVVLASATPKINTLSNSSPNITMFTTPVSVTSTFYPGIEITYGTGDSISMMCNDFNKPATANFAFFRDKANTSSWYSFSTLKLSFTIYPILCAPTGIIDDILDQSTHLYPNPSTGEVNLVFGTLKPENVVVKVYNAIGEIVYSNKFNNSTGENILLNLNNNTNGVYFVEVSTSEERIMRKVILNH